MRLSSSRAAVVMGATAVAGALWIAGAAAAPAEVTADVTVAVTVDLMPAPTSVDHAPFCDLPDAPADEAAAPGATAVTFTILPRGC